VHGQAEVNSAGLQEVVSKNLFLLVSQDSFMVTRPSNGLVHLSVFLYIAAKGLVI